MSSVIKVNTLQDAGGNSLLVSDGSGSITTNNINVKDIDWQSVVTSDTTMVAGKGYIVDSSGGTKTMTLPSSPSAGDIVAVYQSGEYPVTVARNSSNIESGTTDITLTNGSSLELVYSSSASIGWIRTNNDVPEQYISATGGTETTSGNYKIHTFNSSSNFVVSSIASTPTNNDSSYLVVAGGGAGGGYTGGGGGAGGFREGTNAADPYAPGKSPLASSSITLLAATYPITVGAGGTAHPSAGAGSKGSNSVFSTITSAGGGSGGGNNQCNGNDDGGSGGGGGENFAGGSGNTPPTSPPQGRNGGTGSGPGPNNDYYEEAGGGGGAGAAGGGGTHNGGTPTGNGGNGVATSITGSPVTYAGGGGGGKGAISPAPAPSVPQGGTGGGGNGSYQATQATAGTANRGGGGGGSGASPSEPAPTYPGKAGGSGVVIIRYKYQG